MKKILLTIVVFTSLAMTTQAALLAHWSFDSYAGGIAALRPDDGNQLGDTFTPGNGTGTPTFTAGIGTPLNDPRSLPATPSINVGAGTAANGSTFTIQVNGVGYSAFTVSFEVNKSGSGVKDFTWAYSTGSGFTDITPQSATASGYQVLTFNFSGVTALNNASSIFLRATLNGATGSGSTTDFDNFQVNAVPEPVNVALVLFGLGVVGMKFGRRLCSFVRR